MSAGILTRLRLGARHGQILPIFALMLIVLIGMTGLAIDLAHTRSVAEDAQQAADAGALAGVAFLPTLPDTAASQAIALSGQNNFPCNATPVKDSSILGTGNYQYTYVCDSKTTITINEYPARDRLQEVIATKVPTSFLQAIGYSSISVSRSSMAEYQDPIAMGAPDNQLGNANYPTHAFDNFSASVHPTTYPQDFYLQIRGPYSGLEHGDAFSPYFMTYNDYGTNNDGNTNSDVLVDSNGSHAKIVDPCANPCKDALGYTVNTNPYYNQENKKTGLTGYSYLFTIPGAPSTGPVKTLLKVLDPLDECFYDGSQPGGQSLPSGDRYVNSPSYASVSGGSNYYHVYPKVVGPSGAKVSTTFLDQCGQAGKYVSNSGMSSSIYTSDNTFPTTLSFTLYNPVYSLTSNFTVAAPKTTTTSSYIMQLADPSTTTVDPGTTAYPSNLGTSYGVQPLYMGPEFQNNGCTVSDSNGPLCTGAHAFKWFTLGAVTNLSSSTAYVMLVVNSVVNQATTSVYANTYGVGGNVFSLGICGDDSTDAHVGNPADSGAWAAASLSSFASMAQAAVAGTSNNPGEPARAAQPGVGNTGDGCLSPGTGYMVNARQAMCIMTEQSGTDSYIPLANIPNVYTGNNVILKLFDPGDVTGADNYLGVMAPQDGGSKADGTVPISVPLTASEPYQMDIAAPSGSGYSQCTYQRPPTWWPTGCGTGGTTDYNATDFPFGSGPIFPVNGATSTALVQVAAASNGDHRFANGTFLDFHIAVPLNYPTQTLTYGNSWWKMYYKLSGGSATDTTTWEIISNAAPVHLIQQ